MNETCETWSIGWGKCGIEATHRVTQTAANVSALACSKHVAMWTRTKRVRGQVVRVHPFVTIEAL